MKFRDLKPGDVVVRLMAETVEMRLRVTGIDDEHDLIECGPQPDGWTFDRATGVEVDTDLGWGPMYGRTGSRIIGVVEKEEA